MSPVLKTSTLRVTVLSAVALMLIAPSGALGQMSFEEFDETAIVPAEILQTERSNPAALRDIDAATWALLSNNIVSALKSTNKGIRVGAMTQLIRYQDHVDAQKARFDLARIYRNDENDRVRLMATVAMEASGSKWALDYLKRSYAYEKNERVKKTIGAILVSNGEAFIPSPSRSVGRATLTHEEPSTPLSDGLASTDLEVKRAALFETLESVRRGYQLDNPHEVVKELVGIMRTDPDETYRLVAVVTIHAIGHPAGMNAVRRSLENEASPRVRRASIAALTDFFGSAELAGS